MASISKKISANDAEASTKDIIDKLMASWNNPGFASFTYHGGDTIKFGDFPARVPKFIARAECTIDAFRFLLTLQKEYPKSWIYCSYLEPGRGADCTVCVFTTASLETVRRTCDAVVDCHVLQESIATPRRFDGERYFLPWRGMSYTHVRSMGTVDPMEQKRFYKIVKID